MLLTNSAERDTDDRISQSSTTPDFVPAATNRARCPGMSDGEAGWLAIDIGEAYGEDAVDVVENPSAGSSDRVRVAKVETSREVVVICVLLNPPNVSFEQRHSSTRFARSGELVVDLYERLRTRAEALVKTGVSEVTPPNKEDDGADGGVGT